MATGPSQATFPNRELGEGEISALYEALYPVTAKYKDFGVLIGVHIREIRNIEAKYKDHSDCLLEILSVRLNQELPLTCADIDRALRSRIVNLPRVANDFQNSFRSKSIGYQQKGKGVGKVSESDIPLRMSGPEYVQGEVESKSNESENIQRTEKFTEVERQIEPKSNEIENEICEYSHEQPEPDEYKKDRRKATHKVEMAAGSQRGAELDQKRKKSLEKSKHKVGSTDESSDACKERAVKSKKMGKAKVHSELKPHQSAIDKLEMRIERNLNL